MINLILAGGSGTRLWPLSRKLLPKQFLQIFDGLSLFQKTILRNFEFVDKFIIIVNEEQFFLAYDQLEELKNDYQLSITNYQFILEPFGKNTAPAIAFSCFDAKDIIFVTPADHLIENDDNYKRAIYLAKNPAKNNLITFGITPTFPNIGYGYIEANALDNRNEVLNVNKFHEKPDLETAKKYLKESKYFWNSGMFVFDAKLYLDELKKHKPKVYKKSKIAYENAKKDNNLIRIKPSFMQEIEDISIDYAVMEKSENVKVIKSDFQWNDVGSFDTLIDKVNFDNLSNVVEIDSKNNFYYSNNKKIISTIGLEDFIVIDTNDALLISKKGETQKVKKIVNKLKSINHSLLTTHSIVYRPWGTYEVLINEKNYKIKRIVVKPGKRLSLQKHFHRNEHWIVVSGTATVTVGDNTYYVRPNESTYIKMGEVHRLANEGKIPVILIEVQVGEYTGEDDIVRIEDDYKRY